MSSLGSPTQRTRSTDELLRTVLNAILEEKIKNQGIKAQQPITTISAYETVELSDANPTITSTAAGGYTYDDVTENAVGIWKFNEGTGTTVSDSSGTGNNGSATGMTWSTGRYGYGGSFDGVDDTVSVNDSSTLNPSTITIACWVNPKDPQVQAFSFFIRKTSTNAGYELWLNNNSSSGAFPTQIRYRWNGSVGHVDTAVEMSANVWQHVAVTNNGSTTTVFKNGSALFNAAGTTINAASVNLTIVATLSNQYKGGLDDLRIYSRALTTTEITRLSKLSFYDQGDYE